MRASKAIINGEHYNTWNVLHDSLRYVVYHFGIQVHLSLERELNTSEGNNL